MRLLKLLGIITILIAPTSAMAKYPKNTGNGWATFQYNDSCSSSIIYEDGTFFSISLDWRDDTIWVNLANAKWQSLDARKDQTTRVEFDLSGNVEYDNWYANEASIRGAPIFGFALWFGRQHKIDLLTNWSIAKGFTATADGKSLGSFRLLGSRAAVLELVRCAAEGLKKDPSDPFAK